MNVLDADKYSDEADFLARFGKGMPTPGQVQDLQVTPSAALLHARTFSLALCAAVASIVLSGQEASGHRPEQVQDLQVTPSAALPACQNSWHFHCIPTSPLFTSQTHDFATPSLRQHLGCALSGWVAAWQEELRPILLWRMKEDAEDLAL